MANVYRLRGYDPFSSDCYDLGGEYATYLEAENAARMELQELEVSQPSAQSGGQDGIQDRVYIVLPNGHLERCAVNGPPSQQVSAKTRLTSFPGCRPTLLRGFGQLLSSRGAQLPSFPCRLDTRGRHRSCRWPSRSSFAKERTDL